MCFLFSAQLSEVPTCTRKKEMMMMMEPRHATCDRPHKKIIGVQSSKGWLFVSSFALSLLVRNHCATRIMSKPSISRRKRRRKALIAAAAAVFVTNVQAFSSTKIIPVTTRQRPTILARAAFPADPSATNSTDIKQVQTAAKHSVEAFDNPFVASAAAAPLVLRQVDVLYGRSHALVYDATQQRFVPQKYNKQQNNAEERGNVDACITSSHRWTPRFLLQHYILPQLSVAFLPSGVTPNYYRFMRWRVLQRWVNANLHVFGTQSLLLGLGLKSTASQLGALSAALQWVLKDCLGKLVRMAWAARMGRRFDSDAKRWRFRSAFIFAAGNFFEITTYMQPRLFLVWATLANCCKQMSMLTSSSTRTALYNSFRDGTRENIGDITAKGEAQIAIVDLIGIASGVCLSRAVGTDVRRIVGIYLLLQTLEIGCMYRQLQSVVYRVLNFERMTAVMQIFAHEMRDAPSARRMTSSSHNTTSTAIPTPAEMAASERIFLPPRHLARRAMAFGSLGRAKLSPEELSHLLQIFAQERYLLVVGANTKYGDGGHGWLSNMFWNKKSKAHRLPENCHIVLHSEATNVDIVKSTLALTLLRDKLVARADSLDPDTMRSADCLDLIRDAQREADAWFSVLLRQLAKKGWESPARFMFGRVHMRAEWPLPEKKVKSENGSSGSPPNGTPSA